MRYTFLGPTGTFTESALLTVPSAVVGERFPSNSVPAALNAVREGLLTPRWCPLRIRWRAG